MRGEEIAYIDANHKVFYVDVDTYPDGAPLVKHERKTYPVRVMLRPRSAAGFLGGIFWVQSLIEQGVRPPELVLPCVFGGRQDRINPSGDTLFTVKSVAKLVNSLGCPRVLVLDPHSEATAAAIDRCTAYHVDEIFQLDRKKSHQMSGAYDAVIAPDAGAAKRAQKVAKIYDVPVLQAWKNRDVKTGKITGFGVELDAWSPKLDQVLVVDDLCDGGGTFLGLHDVLPGNLKVDLYVTHGLFTAGTQDLTSKFRNVYCTDSVVTQRLDVKIIKTCDYILQYGDIG
jgi:ribose-phosphate pyrophosphokinase